MSTTTAYGAKPDLRDVLVITVSQSGGSPGLVASTRAAREAGAITLAVTNNPDSPLAAVSEHHIDILAGPEKALPATKTYCRYLFVEGLRGGDDAAAQILREPAEPILARKDEIKPWRRATASPSACDRRKHPRAAAPGRDPQPVRHRSPELLGRRCAVPPAGERCRRSQGRERGHLDPLSCAGRVEALS